MLVLAYLGLALGIANIWVLTGILAVATRRK